MPARMPTLPEKSVMKGPSPGQMRRNPFLTIAFAWGEA